MNNGCCVSFVYSGQVNKRIYLIIKAKHDIWIISIMSKKKGAYNPYSKKPEVSANYNEENPHPLVAGLWSQIDNQFYKLKKTYLSWLYNHGQYKNIYEADVIKRYLQYYLELTEVDIFYSSNKGLLTIKKQELANSPSEDIVFKSFGILNGTAWGIRLTNKFLQRICQHQGNGAKNILAIMLYLANGSLPGQNYKDSFFRIKSHGHNLTFDYTSFFSMRIFINKNIIFNVGVERIPIMDRNQRITRYEFKPYINFIDIINDNRIATEINDIISQQLSKLNDDVARGPEVVDDLIPLIPKHREQIDYLFNVQKIGLNGEFAVVRSELSSEIIRRYSPPVFEPVYLSNAESSSLIFDTATNRWLNSDVKMRIERKKYNLYLQSVNKQMLKKYVDFQSAKNLVDLLQKIPNFRIALTEEEKNVIGQNGNVMVIGRSGTGKTTCAVMRLFAIEMLFKIRFFLNKKKFEAIIKDTRFDSDDLDQNLGLHSIFVTASPVLTNEIQRYYKKLTDQIKDELEKKKKRQSEKKKQEQEEQRQRAQDESVQVIDQSNIEQKAEEIQQIKEEAPQILKQVSEEEAEQMQEFQHITQEFEGITLEEKPQEEINNEQDIVDEDFEELEQKINKFGSLNDLEQSDYPGFFTVRALIMMIDGTLKRPFFLRSGDNKIVGKESKAAWHNEEKGVMMIENYFKKMQLEGNGEEEKVEDVIEQQLNYSDEEQLEHEYQRQLRLREQKNKQDFKNRIINSKTRNQMSFEIDYDYFALHFWPQIQKRYYTEKNIAAHMIWTEIYSTIKGSANSHLYPGGYLPEKVYLEKCQNMFLTDSQKREIYESFCQYERWKTKIYAYDLMDIINYINTQLKWSGYYGPSIHYLMIDEVQDLPHSILYLLSRVAEQGVFFSGDTAQTIAKGVGFRFGDLRTMFDGRYFDSEIKLEKPAVLQLTVNFRSHNNILQLANSVVSIIQVLFPKTIDRLKKERSDLHGPKPMLLADADEELLFLVLCGEEFYKKQLLSEEGDLMKRPPLQFGCDQVIIVRDQESKKKIPSILQHALCLTIYEAKGLQFNDVILFNFFAESKCQDRWGIFKYISVVDEQIDKEEYLRSITKHQVEKQRQQEVKQKKDNAEDFGETQLLETSVKGQKVIVKKIKPSSNISIKDLNDYGELCSDLKLLYTAITRPRNTLIIYDQSSANRKVVEKYWERVGVTETITKQILETVKGKGEKASEEAQIFQSLISKTDSSEWKNQGLKMFKRKYFEQAMKCFERSGDKDLYVKAQANNLANESTKSLIEIEAERGYMKQKLYNYNSSDISKTDLTVLKNKLKYNEKTALKNFITAGKLFESLGMWKQSAQCYFSGKDFESAKASFEKEGMDKQVGESLFMLEKYQQASEYFDKSGDYAKTIECLDMINDWSGILKVITKYSDKIPEAEKQTLIRKYAALSLEELVQSIEFENDDQKEIEMKKEIVQPLVIEEKQSDEQEDSQEEEEDEDEDSDPEAQAQKEYNKKMSAELSKKASEELENIEESRSIENQRKQSYLSSQNTSLVKQQSNISNLSQSQQVIKPLEQSIKQQSPKQQTQPKAEVSNNSSQVQVVEDSEDSSFFKLNNPSDASHSVNSSWVELNEPDMEIVKSIADPSDEWLKSAFSQIDNKSHTDYSIIDDADKLIKNARIIKTKGNIFIQDNVMEKIIEIVSIVNINIEDYLTRLKGHQALITKKKEGVENIQISDFEEIQPEFVFKILDTLESFKIYKLCIFVCNRYHMPSKLGRYIASMMLKYSITAQQNLSITPSLLAPGPHRKSLLEKSILSSVALHSILENINPEFLKIKVDDKNQDSSLGTYFITALVLEGLYKKIIFIVNVEEALAILYNYLEADTYKTLYITNFLKKENPDKFTFYPETPTESHAVDYTIFMAESVIWKKLFKASNKENNHPLVSAYFSKEHSIRSLQLNQILPDYFSYNKALWRYIFKKDNLQELVTKAKQFNKDIPDILNSEKVFSEVEIYDIITFGLVLLNSEQLIDVYMKLSYNQVAVLHNNFKKIHRFISTLHSFSRNRRNILKAVLSVYQARIISPKSKTMSIFGDSFIFIHRSSSIITDLVEYRRKKLIQFQEKTAKLVDHSFKFYEQFFFCEQNLDVLMAPLAVTLEHISQRMLKALMESLNKYSLNLYESEDTDVFLHEDILNLEEKYIMAGYCKFQSQTLYKRYQRFRPKAKTAVQHHITTKANYANLSKERKHAPKITKTLISHQVEDLEDSDDYVAAVKDGKFGFLYEHTFNHHSNLHPELQNFLLEKYNSGKSRKINYSKFLYVSNQNKLLREFSRRMKGFLLYDALEFKLFNRIDMYAINLLDAMNELSYVDQCYYIVDCLVNLIIHYNSINNKVFKVQLPTSLLKFVKNIKFEEYISPEGKTDNFRQQIIGKSAEAIFSCEYRASADEDAQGIQSLIKECINNILDLIDSKAFTNAHQIKEIFTAIVLNIPINDKLNEDIQCVIRKVHPKSKSILGRIESLATSLIPSENKKPCLLEDHDGVSIHQIKFNNTANHETNLNISEKDYNNYDITLGKRIRAVRTIQRLLKKIIKSKPIVSETPIAKKKLEHQRYDVNWVTVIHNVQPGFEHQLFKTASELTADLNAFYMQNAISSALDLHFILMTMLRINELRQQLIELGQNDEIEQIGQDEVIEKIRIELNNMKNDILNWKADEKWRMRNTHLKKKKVFELKWLSKTHEMKVIKKRQGLKKQAVLQDKKILTKFKR